MLRSISWDFYWTRLNGVKTGRKVWILRIFLVTSVSLKLGVLLDAVKTEFGLGASPNFRGSLDEIKRFAKRAEKFDFSNVFFAGETHNCHIETVLDAAASQRKKIGWVALSRKHKVFFDNPYQRCRHGTELVFFWFLNGGGDLPTLVACRFGETGKPELDRIKRCKKRVQKSDFQD